MDPKMTGEPSQEHSVHPSVFSFDPYPPTQPIMWNQANPFANSQFIQNPTNILFQQINVPPPSQTLPPFGNVPFPVETNVLGNVQATHSNDFMQGFSFGGPKPQQPSEGVVQFPFQISQVPHGFEHKTIRCKRKTDSPPLQPLKQHITEEKMAEHMSKLHISSETAMSKETETSRMQRLYMCEEMRKLQSDSIIPPSLLSKMQQPCKALVLWQPPTRLIPPGIANPDVDENDNNNGDSFPDNNAVGNLIEAEMDNELVNNMDMDNC